MNVYSVKALEQLDLLLSKHDINNDVEASLKVADSNSIAHLRHGFMSVSDLNLKGDAENKSVEELLDLYNRIVTYEGKSTDPKVGGYINKMFDIASREKNLMDRNVMFTAFDLLLAIVTHDKDINALKVAQDIRNLLKMVLPNDENEAQEVIGHGMSTLRAITEVRNDDLTLPGVIKHLIAFTKYKENSPEEKVEAAKLGILSDDSEANNQALEIFAAVAKEQRTNIDLMNGIIDSLSSATIEKSPALVEKVMDLLRTIAIDTPELAFDIISRLSDITTRNLDKIKRGVMSICYIASKIEAIKDDKDIKEVAISTVDSFTVTDKDIREYVAAQKWKVMAGISELSLATIYTSLKEKETAEDTAKAYDNIIIILKNNPNAVFSFLKIFDCNNINIKEETLNVVTAFVCSIIKESQYIFFDVMSSIVIPVLKKANDPVVTSAITTMFMNLYLESRWGKLEKANILDGIKMILAEPAIDIRPVLTVILGEMEGVLKHADFAVNWYAEFIAACAKEPLKNDHGDMTMKDAALLLADNIYMEFAYGNSMGTLLRALEGIIAKEEDTNILAKYADTLPYIIISRVASLQKTEEPDGSMRRIMTVNIAKWLSNITSSLSEKNVDTSAIKELSDSIMAKYKKD